MVTMVNCIRQQTTLEYCSAVASIVGATGKPQLVLCS